MRTTNEAQTQAAKHDDLLVELVADAIYHTEDLPMPDDYRNERPELVAIHKDLLEDILDNCCPDCAVAQIRDWLEEWERQLGCEDVGDDPGELADVFTEGPKGDDIYQITRQNLARILAGQSVDLPMRIVERIKAKYAPK